MARQTLNSKFLDSVKTDRKQEDFWDTKIKGFGIRVTKYGRKTWFIFYRIGSRKRRYTLGTYPALDLYEARRMANESIGQIFKGEDPALNKNTCPFFSEMALRYMNEHAKTNKRSWREDERALKKDLLPFIGSFPSNQISKRDITQLIERISDRGSKTQANRTLALVRKIFNFGIEKSLIEVSPCLGVKKPNKEISRDRVLSEVELRNILQAMLQLNTESSDLLRLILYTAQRSKEVKHMRWQDIDFKTGFWTIPGNFTKNGKSHRVPLSPTALEIIKHRQSHRFNSDWVFPSRCDRNRPFQAHQKALHRLRILSGVEFRGHDFRRTAATIMASLGVQRTVLMKLLNHSENSITTVYDRYSYDDEKKNAIELWGNYLVKQLYEKDCTGHGAVTQ